jgi:hypothetical protein
MGVVEAQRLMTKSDGSGEADSERRSAELELILVKLQGSNSLPDDPAILGDLKLL